MKNNIVIFFGLLIIIITIFSGCTKGENTRLQNKYGFQPPIDKLYWGMSLDEIEKTLSIQNGEEGVIYNHENLMTSITLSEKIIEFGYEATVTIDIQDAIDEEWFPYSSSSLSDVKLIYTDIDTQKLKENMIKEFGDSGRDRMLLVNNECTTWESIDKISSLDPEILSKLEEYWRILNKHNEEGTTYSAEKSEEESINIVTLTLGKLNSAMITYQGDTAVPINKVCIDKSK